MASANVKKQCAKCSKGGGVATCDGCQQSFCIKHFGEHRQELSHQMENVGQEHDLLRRDLGQQNTKHPLFLQINTWEQESITKIQAAAETARADLQQLLDENKRELEKSVTKITDELQSCRESDDYTEIDINKWTQQLQALRKMLESPSTISIAENETPKSIIRLIRVREEQQHHSSNFAVESLQHRISAVGKPSSSCNEKFDEVIEGAIVSEEGFVATRHSRSIFFSTIYGANRYSSGTHCIHFRIDKIGKLSCFFGITTFSEKMKRVYDRHISQYGWWDLDQAVVSGKIQENEANNIVRMGDKLTLTLDCDNRRIQLQHHRTNRLVQLLIDLDNCSFRWKIVVKLQSEGDSIRILK